MENLQLSTVGTEGDGGEQERIVVDVVDAGRHRIRQEREEPILDLRRHQSETNQQNEAPYHPSVQHIRQCNSISIHLNSSKFLFILYYTNYSNLFKFILIEIQSNSFKS